MNEEAIQQILDQACGDPSLYFQVMQQEPYLYVFINRQTEADLDYDSLTPMIWGAVAQLNLPNMNYLALYSRVLGNADPDWETCLELGAYPVAEEVQSHDAPRDSGATNSVPGDFGDLALDQEDVQLEANQQIGPLEGDPIDPGGPIDLGNPLDYLDDVALDSPQPEPLIQTRNLSGTSAPMEEPEQEEPAETLIELQDEPLMSIDSRLPDRTPQITTDPAPSSPQKATVGESAPPEPAPPEPGPVAPSTPQKTVSPPSSPSPLLDLSRFCFIRDKTLLGATLVPSEAIAQNLLQFHQLAPKEKTQVLSALGKIMKSPQLIQGKNVPLAIQQWFVTVPRSNPKDLNQFALWISRYCAEPERTLAQCNQALGLAPEPTVTAEPGIEPPPDLPAATATNSALEVLLPEAASSEPNSSSESSSPDPSAQATPETSDFDLSSYCFYPNKRLLTSALKAPPPNLARAIVSLHNLANSDKESVLQTLDKIFQSPQFAEIQGLPDEVQLWLQEIAESDSETVRKAKIWFSRYCLNPEKTLEEVDGVMQLEAAKAAAAAAEPELELEEEPESITLEGSPTPSSTPSRISSKRTSSSTRASAQTPRVSTFPIAEFVILTVVSLGLAIVAKAILGVGLTVDFWIGLVGGVIVGMTGNLKWILSGVGGSSASRFLLRNFLSGLVWGVIAGSIIGFGIYIIVDRYFEQSGRTKPVDFSDWIINTLKTRDGAASLGSSLGCFLLISSFCLGGSSPCGCKPSTGDSEKLETYGVCTQAEESLGGSAALQQAINSSLPLPETEFPQLVATCWQALSGQEGEENNDPSAETSELALEYQAVQPITKGVYRVDIEWANGEEGAEEIFTEDISIEDLWELQNYFSGSCVLQNSATGIQTLKLNEDNYGF